MGWKEFFASVIGDVLSWPVIILVVILTLLKPLKALIGRVKGAKGFGGEVEFNELVEDAEISVNRALDEDLKTHDNDPKRGTAKVESSSSATNEDEQVSTPTSADNQKIVDPSRDPSGAILVSWGSLIETLAELSRTTAGRGRPAVSPRAILDQLKRNEQVSSSFYEAVDNLSKVRNQVAHGEAVPTSGVAFSFVEQAQQLQTVAKGMLAVEKMDLDRPAF